MDTVTCTTNQYTSNTGECCDRCEAGSYLKAECDGSKASECAECGRGHFLAAQNHMKRCHDCTVCNSDSNLRVEKECTAQEDTVCTCMPGFYCSNQKCEHCQPVRYCPLGEGVKVRAFHTKDTVCGACEEGTYSNVTDFHSPCRAHTRCEDLGRALSRPGTATSDAVCGDFRPNCHWLVPAGLWSGLVLVILVLLAFCWWLKRRSQRSVCSPIIRVTAVDVIPAAPQRLLSSDYKPQTCAVDGCDLPVYKPDHDTDPCSTPLQVSFTESRTRSGSTDYCTNNFHRSTSEPQEDEWCGT